MGRRGPKPEPAAVKKAKASSRRPIGEDPQPEVQAATIEASPKVSMPAWLDQEARKIWSDIAPRLVGLKLLTQTDAFTFARYCTNCAMWLKMHRQMRKRGTTYEVTTASGRVRRAAPEFSIASRLERELQAAEANFGLNPAERQRIFAARAANPVNPDLVDQMGANKPAPTQSDKPDAPAGGAVGYLN